VGKKETKTTNIYELNYLTGGGNSSSPDLYLSISDEGHLPRQVVTINTDRTQENLIFHCSQKDAFKCHVQTKLLGKKGHNADRETYVIVRIGRSSSFPR
jgi:hypothetical protein